MFAKIKRIPAWFFGHKKISTLLLLVLVFVFFVSRRGNGKFETASIMQGEVLEELVLSGQVVAERDAKLAYSTGGEISSVSVVEGQEVKKGAFLGKIDTLKLNSDFERAKADLRDAEANVEKVHDDVKNHDSDETYTQKLARTDAETAKDKAYEAYLKAQKDLLGASLFSPFDGIVTHVAHSFSGINVLSTETQFEVVDPSSIYFSVSADQTEVVKLHVGQEVDIVLDAFEDKTLKGTVDSVSYSPIENEVGSVYEVKVKFQDISTQDQLYRIGLTGDATLVTDKKENVLYVPPKFVKQSTEGQYLLINEGRDKVFIETGIEGADKVEVVGDISQGTVIYD